MMTISSPVFLGLAAALEMRCSIIKVALVFEVYLADPEAVVDVFGQLGVHGELQYIGFIGLFAEGEFEGAERNAAGIGQHVRELERAVAYLVIAQRLYIFGRFVFLAFQRVEVVVAQGYDDLYFFVYPWGRVAHVQPRYLRDSRYAPYNCHKKCR